MKPQSISYHHALSTAGQKSTLNDAVGLGRESRRGFCSRAEAPAGIAMCSAVQLIGREINLVSLMLMDWGWV